MKLESNWKIRASHVFSAADADAILSIKIDGSQLLISLDGMHWKEMGALKAPLGMAGQSSYKIAPPMEWDSEKQQVVPSKGY